MSTDTLIAVSESTHAAHHAQHVVVRGVHADLGRRADTHGVVGHREEERRVVDTR